MFVKLRKLKKVIRTKYIVAFMGLLLIITFASFILKTNNFFALEDNIQLKNTVPSEKQLSNSLGTLNDQIIQLIDKKDWVDLKTKLDQRVNKIAQLSEFNPEESYKQELPNYYLEKIPKDISAPVETPIVLKGEINVIHADLPSGIIKKAVLTSSGVDYTVLPNDQLKLQDGRYDVEITGKKLQNLIFLFVTNSTFKVTSNPNHIADTNQISFAQANIIPKGTDTPNLIDPVAVILVRCSDTPSDINFTREQFVDPYGKHLTSYYSENSYGKYTVQPVVYGPFTLSMTCSGNWLDDTKVINLTWDQVNYKNYQNIIILPFNGGMGGFSSGGKYLYHYDKGDLYTSIAVINVYSGFFDGNLLPSGKRRTDLSYGEVMTFHEFGHSLGLSHAQNLDCEDQPIYGNCWQIEYGNLFDPMGVSYGGAGTHYQARNKVKLGWMDDHLQEVQQSGTYFLKPLETNNRIVSKLISPYGKVIPAQAQIVPKSGNIQKISPVPYYYYLEWREPLGYDKQSLQDDLTKNNINGIMVNKIPINYFEGKVDEDSYDLSTIDFSPIVGYNEDRQEVALLPGQEFKDTGGGITIKNLGRDDSNKDDPKLDYKVTYSQPNCIEVPSRPDYYNYGEYPGSYSSVQHGSYSYKFIYVNNRDGYTCSPSRIVLTNFEIPTGWEYYIMPNGKIDQIVDPGQHAVGSLSFTVPENAEKKIYKIKFTITTYGPTKNFTEDKYFYVSVY